MYGFLLTTITTEINSALYTILTLLLKFAWTMLELKLVKIEDDKLLKGAMNGLSYYTRLNKTSDCILLKTKWINIPDVLIM